MKPRLDPRYSRYETQRNQVQFYCGTTTAPRTARSHVTRDTSLSSTMNTAQWECSKPNFHGFTNGLQHRACICDPIRRTKHHKTGCECVCGLASVLFPISTPLIPAVQWRWWRRPVSGDEQWETRAYRRANTTSGQWSRTRAMPPVAGSRSSHQVTQVTQVTRHTLSPPHRHSASAGFHHFLPGPHPGIPASWHPGIPAIGKARIASYSCCG